MPNQFPNNPAFLALADPTREAELYYQRTFARCMKETKEACAQWFKPTPEPLPQFSHYSTHQHLRHS